MYYFLAVLFGILAFAIRYVPKAHKTLERNTTGHLEERMVPIKFPFKILQRGFAGIAAVLLGVGLFFGSFFYAQPGYMYHVRTVFGTEYVVNETGWKPYYFGWYNAWKKAMSIQAIPGGNSVDSESESQNLTASLPPKRVVFLDQVDAQISATVRYRLPTDEASFLPIAQEYRSPENLVRTTLIPSFQETLDANGSLMTAEEYFSGGRTNFNRDFEDQMENGIFIVRRIEDQIDAKQAEATADASRGEDQLPYGDEEQIVLRVEKLYGPDGQPRRKAQSYGDWGITVVESRITNVIPNEAFDKRMTQKQDASARRAVARETRIEEEEQRLLAITRGEREAAERQAQWKVDQIEKTTKAETEKAIALVNANRQKEQAEIEKETAAITLERDQISAQSIQVLADAAAYEREALLQADNALQLKLDTEVAIQKVWAQAFSQRKVPNNLWVTGATDTDAPMAGNTELQQIQQLMTMQLAKTLDYDRKVEE